MKFDDYMKKYAYVEDNDEPEEPESKSKSKSNYEIEIKSKQHLNLKKDDCGEIKIEAANVYITITCGRENEK